MVSCKLSRLISFDFPVKQCSHASLSHVHLLPAVSCRRSAQTSSFIISLGFTYSAMFNMSGSSPLLYTQAFMLLSPLFWKFGKRAPDNMSLNSPWSFAFSSTYIICVICDQLAWSLCWWGKNWISSPIMGSFDAFCFGILIPFTLTSIDLLLVTIWIHCTQSSFTR